MNKASTYGLIFLCALALLATLDQALGLGGGALLADICRTILDDDMGGEGMGGMSMDIKPVPIIALSLAFTAAAILALTRDQNRTLAGRSVPDTQERAAILSAMYLVARANGKISQDEVRDVFTVVTSHPLESQLVELFVQRFDADKTKDPAFHLEPVDTSIGRRRTLAAALLVGCVGRPHSDAMLSLIQQIAVDIGASAEDIQAARAALNEWQEGCEPVQGVSPVALMRHRALSLSAT